MAKNRRGKKSRKNKKPEIDPDKSNIENLRNSVSGDIFNNSTIHSLHIVDVFNPTATPSPKSETDRTSDETSEENDNPIVFDPIATPDNCIYETPKTSLRKLKFDLNESSSGEEYQTPLKRIKSIVRVDNKIYKKTERKNYDSVFVTPCLFNKPNMTDKIISGTLHYSTPKDIIYQKVKSDSNLIKIDNNFTKHSFASLHSLSPIMKHDIEERLSKVCLTPLPPVLLTPTKKVFNKIRRYGRFNVRLPVSFISLCSWLGITIKKALASIKRICYESMQQSITAVAETSTVISRDSPNCPHCNCQSKIQSLNSKMKNLATELSCIRSQLQVIVTENTELKSEINDLKQRKQCIAPPPPPPPPPPPLPPPPQPLPLITPRGRPLKNSIRNEKQTNENSRPLITVDDILGVRLRKINSSNPGKKQEVNEEIFKQVKLRPARNRSKSPSMLISPRASLARILKNVDTNVRRVRRYKLTTSVNIDDASRQRYSVVCNPTNETAPDIKA